MKTSTQPSRTRTESNAQQRSTTVDDPAGQRGLMAARSPLDRVTSLTRRIAGLEADRQTAIALAVAAGATWAEIGRALGVSTQAAHKHYRWMRHSPITGETWQEPPLPW